MAVSFKIINKDGSIFCDLKGAACYAGYQGNDFTLQETIIHYPSFRVGKEKAQRFYSLMKDIGFHVDDPERIVVEEEYCYPIHQKFFGHETTSRSWMMGNLAMSRMVDEFAGTVEDFLALVDVMPTADKFQLFQLAHFVAISKGYRFGSNHSVVNYGWGHAVVPTRYQTWYKVAKWYLTEDSPVTGSRYQTGVHQMFSPLSERISKTDEYARFPSTIEEAIAIHERITSAEQAEHLRCKSAALSEAIRRSI
jgi:hypothetical protein